MSIAQIIKTATGNGKTVNVYKVTTRSTGTTTYSCEVNYADHAYLDFSQSKQRKADAIRWFKTWSHLTTY